MSTPSSKPISQVLNSAATIGGVIGIIALFVPFGRDFMLNNPLWGWAFFLGAIIIGPTLTELVASRRVENATRSLRGRLDEFNLPSQQKDIELIKARLGRLDQTGDVYEYLADNPAYGHLPIWFSSTLATTLSAWERDVREIKDAVLRAAWIRCLEQARLYSKLLDDNLRSKARNPGALEIDPALQDSVEYGRAINKIRDAENNFKLALQALHHGIHAG